MCLHGGNRHHGHGGHEHAGHEHGGGHLCGADTSGLPASAVTECAVMHSAVVKADAEAAGLVRDYEGMRFWLCCPRCAEKWDADPAQYAVV